MILLNRLIVIFVALQITSCSNTSPNPPPEVAKAESSPFDKGMGDLLREHYQDAIVHFSKAILADSIRGEVFYQRGYSKFKLKDYAGAMEDFKVQIKFTQKLADSYYYLAECFDDLGERDDAISSYSKAIEANPKYSEAYNNRGLLENSKHDYEHALKDFNQAILLDSTMYQSYLNLGLSLINIKEYQEAIYDFTKAISIQPFDPHSFFNRGVAFYYLKEYNSAMKDFSQAIHLDNKYGPAYANLGIVYYKLHKSDEACQSWKAGMEVGDTESKDNYNELCLKKRPSQDKHT